MELERKICSSLLHRKTQQGSGEFTGRSSSECPPFPGMSAGPQPAHDPPPLHKETSSIFLPADSIPLKSIGKLYLPSLLEAKEIEEAGNCMEVTDLPGNFSHWD